MVSTENGGSFLLWIPKVRYEIVRAISFIFYPVPYLTFLSFNMVHAPPAFV